MSVKHIQGNPSSNMAWVPNGVEVSDQDYQVEDDVDYVRLMTPQQVTLPATPGPFKRVVIMSQVDGSSVVGGRFPLFDQPLALDRGFIFWFIFSGSDWFYSG